MTCTGFLRRRLRRCCAHGLSAGLAAVFAAARVPAANLDFETIGDAGRLTSWAGAASATAEAHDGRAAPVLSAAGRRSTLFQQRFPGLVSGRLSFWYKAVDGVAAAEPVPETNLNLSVVPVTGDGSEYPPHSRARYEIPAAHIGDGQWHRGEIRFNYLEHPQVAAVYIGPRINELVSQTMPTGPGTVLFDTFRIEPLGPELAMAWVRIDEDPGREGRDGVLACQLVNTGDATAQDVRLTVRLPSPLSTVTDVVTIGNVPPLARRDGRWRLSGARVGTLAPIVVGIASSTGHAAEAELPLRPDLVLEQVALPQRVHWRGREQMLRFTVANRGTCTAADVHVRVTGPAGMVVGRPTSAVDMDALTPGAQTPLSVPLRAVADAPPGHVSVRVNAADAQPATAARWVVTSRAPDTGSDDAALVLRHGPRRLLWPRNDAGLGVAAVQIHGPEGWRTAAVMPWLARIAVACDDGTRADHAFYGSVSDESADGSVVLASSWTDPDGVSWHCRAAFEAAASPWFDVRVSVTAARPRNVLRCDGATVLVGEGEAGSAKDAALFPGLDYLDADERSSRTWNPRTRTLDERTAPDPMKVTMPFMAVGQRDVVTAVMWDALAPWDGTHDRVSPRFLSPDFEQGCEHHVLNLFVPTVPRWVTENGRYADPPYELAAGQSLTFSWQLVVKPGGVLDIQDVWLARYGMPAVPRKPCAYETFLNQAIDAENEYRFNPERYAWRHVSKLPVGRGQFNPQLCTVMWVQSMRTDDPRRRAALRRLVRDASAEHARRLELILPFHVGHLDEAVPYSRVQMERIMDEQLPEGGWGLRKREGLPAWIGRDGTVLSGTCSHQVHRLMRHALVTGEQDVYEAGLRGLAAIERDPIPRGGQTWEVPVQVADIIVAAHTASAYLNAYRISGRRDHLDRAVVWARKGVHFIYHWQHPSQAVMAGCSIPVYGNNWFGRPVQWCGREMLRPMLDLHDLGDRSMPWRHLAECVSVALMQQTLMPDLRMYPDTAETPAAELYWTYPYEGWRNVDACRMMFVDNFWLTSPRRFPCWFHMISLSRVPPYLEGFLQSLFRLMGVNTRPQTVVLKDNDDRIHVTAAGELSALQASTENLSFTLRYWPGETSHVLVAGLKQAPRHVRVDRRDLPHVDDLDDVREGWRWDGQFATVRIADAETVRVDLVRGAAGR